ncbi:MAG TPA: outer membrane protein assembly factor BamE [Methylocystis sp.]|nr:outer membrane protein assembly factor BamE [Methylocystis sp.]
MRARHLRYISSLTMAVLALAPLSGCIGYDGVVNRGAVVEPRKLAQVKPGMPAQAALAALGSPSTTSTVGGDAWYYVSQRTERQLAFMNPKITDQHVLALYFDRDKKVQRIADYGLEDGKVVDFLSRTTPVVGGDATFIRSLLASAGSWWPF